ncbi:MAG: hypothetical protein H0T05_03360 [Acidobacteria bacterium]|nr:hypothetical protein [Acidobacteriota bacterium]
MGLLARLVGIITAPTDTYRSVVTHPRWLGMLALTTLFTVGMTTGFMLTEVGQNAWLDSVLTGSAAPEQVQAMERVAPFAGYIAGVSILVAAPLMLLVVAGILFAVFNAALGGTATFKQIFTVAVPAGAIGVLAQLFTVPLNYMRESLTSSTSLAVMLPMLEPNSFAAKFAGAIDLFLIWQVVVLAIGLGVLYRRRTQPIAMSLLAIYFLIAVIIAAVTSGS